MEKGVYGQCDFFHTPKQQEVLRWFVRACQAFGSGLVKFCFCVWVAFLQMKSLIVL